MVGYLLASDIGPMLLGQHWPNNQNVVQPTLFDDIGPTLSQFSYAGWVDIYYTPRKRGNMFYRRWFVCVCLSVCL